MVVRTNYNTTMGSMARQLLAPVRMKQADPLLQVSCYVLLQPRATPGKLVQACSCIANASA